MDERANCRAVSVCVPPKGVVFSVNRRVIAMRNGNTNLVVTRLINLMDIKIQDYISSQPKDRQKILSDLHMLIMKNDKAVTPVIEAMMGKEMIIYKGKKMMKYGLASMKEYMSLHALPIYMNPSLHAKYQSLLDKASFQKGCINFVSAEQMPTAVVTQFIADCSAIDLEKIREDQLKNKKAAKKK
jgi:hypothetical protein